MLICPCFCLFEQVGPNTSIPIVGMDIATCIDANVLSMVNTIRPYNFPVRGKHDPGVGSEIIVGFVPLSQQVVKGGLCFSIQLNFTYPGKPDNGLSITHTRTACHKA